MKDSTSSKTYTLTGCIALLLWAGSFPLVKRISEDLGPLTSYAVEYSTAGIILLILAFLSGHLRHLSFLKNREFYLRTLLFVSCIVLLSVSIGCVSREKLPVVILINYLWPTLTMLFSVWLLRQSFDPRWMAIGTVIVIAGLVIEIVGEAFFRILADSFDARTIVAYGAAFITAVCWALFSTLSGKWKDRAGETSALPFMMITAGIIVFILGRVFHEESHLTSGVYGPLIYICLMPVVANVCWDIGVRKGNIITLSLLSDGLPWANLTVTHLYLGVTIGWRSIISAILIVSGALISRYALIKRRVVEPPPVTEL